jgi:TPR repeat protein
MYFQGDGVLEDHRTAAKYFTLAAEQGDADSQYNLGQMYREGKVLPQNDKTALSWFARSWYTKAAEQGHSKCSI